MAALRDKFLDRCRSDAAILADRDTIDADELIAIVHRLSGTAGIFGFTELSEAAERTENALREGRGAQSLIDRLIAELRSTQTD